MYLGIEGRTALVMGASRGIGRAIATTLAREGARVALAARTREALDEAIAEIGAKARAFEADTGDLRRLAALPGKVEKELGPVEILVTNTGGPPGGGPLEHERKDWEAAYRSLVEAPRTLIEAVLPGMRERGWGRIVNVGSTSTIEVLDHLNLSNVHRSAAAAYFKGLARAVAGDGVTVNTVATGRIATDRLASLHGSIEAAEDSAREEVPAGRLGRTEEYGDLVAFLCSERAAYITGATVPIDGGLMKAL